MICEKCGEDATKVGLVVHEATKELWCRPCHETAKGPVNRAHGVVGDEIDIEIRHGLCNPDGSPRRFRSRTDIKRVASRRGMMNYVATEKTPGPDTHKVTFGYGHTKGRTQR